MSSGLTVRGTPRLREYISERVAPGASRLARIETHAIPDPVTGCWVWRLRTDDAGYGRLTIDGRGGYYAHRVAYEEIVGPIPDGLQLDHLCRNRRCCNPAHLEPVTPLVNNLRGETNAAKDVCPNGHSYDEANTYRWPGADNPNGRRTCRVCRRAYRAIYHSMTPEERAARKSAGLPVVDLAAHFAKSPEAAA